MPTLPRSLKAIARLESLQASQVDVTERPAALRHDPHVLRDIAEQQLIAEYIDSRAFSSKDDLTRSLVDLVADPTHQAGVEARTRALENHFLAEDGDLWSRYERPDRRKRLAWLVPIVEKAIADCGYAIARRPTVGTLATRDINAQAIPGPSGEGHIVAFETGLFTFTSTVAGIAAQVLNAQLADDGESLDVLPYPAIGAHIAGHPALLLEFIDLLFSQAVIGTCDYVAAYTVPEENANWAGRVKDAMDVFVLAHEYGHVALGHVDLPGVRAGGDPGQSRAFEFAADRFSLEATTAACGVWTIVGATLLLTALDLIECATATLAAGVDAVEESPTHPTAEQRKAALRAIVQDKYAALGEFALPICDTLCDIFGRLWAYVRPAFEHAHATGIPPRGFTPLDPLQKNWALEQFAAPLFPHP